MRNLLFYETTNNGKWHREGDVVKLLIDREQPAAENNNGTESFRLIEVVCKKSEATGQNVVRSRTPAEISIFPALTVKHL